MNVRIFVVAFSSLVLNACGSSKPEVNAKSECDIIGDSLSGCEYDSRTGSLQSSSVCNDYYPYASSECRGELDELAACVARVSCAGDRDEYFKECESAYLSTKVSCPIFWPVE